MKIGIDLMGGDQTPQMILKAIEHLLMDPQNPHSFIAIAHSEFIRTVSSFSQINFVEAPEYILMNEIPLNAIRRKKNSSMAVGLRLLKEGIIDAFISTGNTGALIGNSIHILPLINGIDRPAIMALLPSESRIMSVLDVGANISCKAHQLVQFALMGIAYQQCTQEIFSPKLGLLNIGTEEGKGTEEIIKAYQLLNEYVQKAAHSYPFDFLGNIEGREAFQGKVDILVTEGFSGNIFLKTSEGIATFMLDFLEKKIKANSDKNLNQLLLEVQQKFDYAEYPGGLLCGVDGLVIKCHGSSNLPSLVNGIKGALKLLKNNQMEKFKERLLGLLSLAD